MGDRTSGYKCKCGKRHQYTGWVHAHAQESLTHTCPCGRKNEIRNYKVSFGTKSTRKKEPSTESAKRRS